MSISSRVALVAALSAFTLAGCSGGDGATVDAPLVDRIDDAVEAVEEFYGTPQQYFEVSATLTQVSVIIAIDDATAAEQAYFVDGTLIDPVPVGEASGATFTAGAIDFDSERIFDELRDELDDPAIIDFAVTGAAGGNVIYDATIASESGGVMLVLLGGDGTVQGVQAS